jgi:predicted metal-dependent phosphoesterase TrpH
MSSRLRVDLHSHTTASDGAAAPRDLVRLAREAGVDVLAVTDHDCVDAVGDCLDEGRARGVRVVPGIEMSSRFEDRDVHVLGFGLDWRSPALLERLSAIHERRRRRVGEICAKLAGLGVPLEPSEVLAEAGGKSVGRKHVARALVKKGLVRTQDEAFGRWLGRGSPADVPVHEMPPQEAARLVADHGGTAVLAHPGFFDEVGFAERVLDASPGIRGVEVWHRYASETRHLAFLGLARRRQLLATGGSDFHGDENPKNGGLGNFLTPPDDWKDLEKRLPPQ